ncbi:MAG TPA: hypothetical protein VHZ51_20230 [Ktedonobacteraceae bacterium]|nr:hypothetical protein [Ktedonobacteraceae bacterium]
MSIDRPTWSGRKATRNYWSEFIGADGRRVLGRLGGVADDRGSYGDKVWIIAGSPAMRAAPGHAFAQ